jgi:dolichol-phosphate mannosyltransferase
MISYSFVVPIYNDGYLAREFCIEFETVFKKYLAKDSIHDDVELIFVNDGSRDHSFDEIKNAANEFSFVKVIELSRNFGQHIALSCGYKYAVGKFVGMLNVDMEDHPDQIPLLLRLFDTDEYDIVYGLRIKRNTALLNTLTSKLFNLTLNKLTGYDTPLNTSTLRVMNRKFVDAYNSLSEKSRFIPGLEMWLGFNKGYTPIVHRKRTKGKSSYNLKKRYLFALESIISFSDKPLRWITFFGFVISMTGFLLNIFLIIQKLFFINFAPGYTSTISIIIFAGGIQILVTGMASLYIGRILKEVQNRPLYIVKNTINF